jgi:hypothetical protein
MIISSEFFVIVPNLICQHSFGRNASAIGINLNFSPFGKQVLRLNIGYHRFGLDAALRIRC